MVIDEMNQISTQWGLNFDPCRTKPTSHLTQTLLKKVYTNFIQSPKNMVYSDFYR